ncbi:hypothetical protein CVV68_13415 [Arthrobacter livingstonensis]|uniref:Uncharacterized protein n=1 Tax=Arthrobacter livingstonensis TaxID=670078 RepID=A0A2V5L880_9MICC|nr:hypothetical protein [Arthrobacter livingstonensis]PYI66564.1 hypothetical protein CVV68_13415 [Arthrobacter livingstonensis]
MEQEVSERIRVAVARRTLELGGRGQISPTDVSVTLEDTDAAPGCRLFTATWGAGRDAGALSGLLRDDDPPDTFPGQAFGKLLERWGGASQPPAADAVAAAAVFLLDPDHRRVPVLVPTDLADSPGAELPSLIVGVPLRGVNFWWSDAGRLARVTVADDGAGKVTVAEVAAGRTGGAP